MYTANIPATLLFLLQTDALSRMVRETLGAEASYQLDAKPVLFGQGMGNTQIHTRVGDIAPDLRPASAIGAVDRGVYSVTKFTAEPKPYAKGEDIDAPSAYAQSAGVLWEQKITRLATWCGKTKGRLARNRVFHAAGGQSIIRRAQTTSDSVLLVDSLAGFRHVASGGAMVPVSSTTPLAVTIVAATTFTALVTGTTPFDTDFPDGPGQITLSAVLSANVAANSYVKATTAAPYIVRPNSRASSEALLVTDLPVLQDILKMRSKLIDDGVKPNPVTGTYHLHVDPYFFSFVTQDTAYRQAFQSAGLSPIFQGNAVWSKAYGITIIESNDAPAVGKSAATDAGFGSTGFTVGATGTPASSKTMVYEGLPVVNSSGVFIRRAIMTGQEFLEDHYVDEMAYFKNSGIPMVHQFSDNVGVYRIGATEVIAANFDRWRMIFRPPMDERALVWTISVSSTFDLLLPVDTESQANTSDARPYKRGIVLEMGAPALAAPLA